MVPFHKITIGRATFCGAAIWGLFVLIFTIWAIIQNGCTQEDRQERQVNQEPCELSCYSVEGCFGWETAGMTLEGCLEACEQSTQQENDCIEDCDFLMDCYDWLDCVMQC